MCNNGGEFKFRSLLILQRLRGSALRKSWQAKLRFIHWVNDEDQHVALLLCSYFHLCVHLPICEHAPQMTHVLVRTLRVIIYVSRVFDSGFEAVTYPALSMGGQPSELDLGLPTRGSQGTKKGGSTCSRLLLGKALCLIKAKKIRVSSRRHISTW